MKSTARKWYSRMKLHELDRLAARLDREIDASALKPLTPAVRASERRSTRKRPGRPRMGKGAKRVLITMEQGLLDAVNAHIRRKNLTRAAFIAKAVRTELAKSA
jgi:hypothetical protein